MKMDLEEGDAIMEALALHHQIRAVTPIQLKLCVEYAWYYNTDRKTYAVDRPIRLTGFI